MKNQSSSSFSSLTNAAARSLLGLLLAAGFTVNSSHAQGQVASGTISSSGSGPYAYNLLFMDSAGATSPIGSVWYAWVPGSFYLPGTPTSAFAPAGWSAAIHGDSIQFLADAPADA